PLNTMITPKFKYIDKEEIADYILKTKWTPSCNPFTLSFKTLSAYALLKTSKVDPPTLYRASSRFSISPTTFSLKKLCEIGTRYRRGALDGTIKL
ncbi:hypothetical protein KKA47_02200, partial [bacterium]|nr:hypothetical protein [bacterium]